MQNCTDAHPQTGLHITDEEERNVGLGLATLENATGNTRSPRIPGENLKHSEKGGEEVAEVLGCPFLEKVGAQYSIHYTMCTRGAHKHRCVMSLALEQVRKHGTGTIFTVVGASTSKMNISEGSKENVSVRGFAAC